VNIALGSQFPGASGKRVVATFVSTTGSVETGAEFKDYI